jgi:hypothetical protein
VRNNRDFITRLLAPNSALHFGHLWSCIFGVCSSSKSCPAGCASAANVVCKDVDVFGIETVSLNHILICTSQLLIIKTIIVLRINVCVCVSSDRIMIIVIALIEWVLSKLYTSPCFLICLGACVWSHACFIIGLWAVE